MSKAILFVLALYAFACSEGITFESKDGKVCLSIIASDSQKLEASAIKDFTKPSMLNNSQEILIDVSLNNYQTNQNLRTALLLSEMENYAKQWPAASAKFALSEKNVRFFIDLMKDFQITNIKSELDLQETIKKGLIK